MPTSQKRTPPHLSIALHGPGHLRIYSSALLVVNCRVEIAALLKLYSVESPTYQLPGI